ncbi:MAG TPA: TonB family protein [Thermoplasmata archaeon]|nr:TonB family protein [Thermoplasmata archaeon]
MSSTVKKISKSPLYFTIPASLLLHAGLYSMGIRPPDFPEAPRAPTFDVTMVIPQNVEAPEKADFIANANQVGSGSEDKKSRIKSQFASNQQNFNTGEDLVDAEKSVAEITPKPEPQILTTKGKTDKFVDKLPEEKPQEDPVTTVVNNSEKTEAIAQLMAEMSKQEEQFARRPRIHFVDSLSAKGSEAAEYIYKWSKKLERIGNINFPQKALDLSLSGTLILNATIDRAGRLVEIQIAVSSGSKILDDAAIKIVKLAAPYDPLSKGIRKKYDQLNITRTLVFHKSEGEEAVFSSN